MKFAVLILSALFAIESNAQAALSPQEIESIRIEKDKVVYTHCDQTGCRLAPVDPSFDRLEKLDGSKVIAFLRSWYEPAICKQEFRRAGSRWPEPQLLLKDCKIADFELGRADALERFTSTGLVQCMNQICVGDRVLNLNAFTPSGFVNYITNKGLVITRDSKTMGAIGTYKKISAIERVCSKAGSCIGDIFEAERVMIAKLDRHSETFVQTGIFQISAISPTGEGEAKYLSISTIYYDTYNNADTDSYEKIVGTYTTVVNQSTANLKELTNRRSLQRCNSGFCVGDVIQPSDLVQKVQSRISYIGKDHVYLEDGTQKMFSEIEKAK